MDKSIAQRLEPRVGKGELTQKDHDEVERDIEVSRIVASILGLAAVTAVNFSQGMKLSWPSKRVNLTCVRSTIACALVVNFYLDDKYKAERDEIIRLSTPDPKAKETEEERHDKIVGYIYEALRS